ncbi:hypothetical protein SAMN05421890_2243 [Ensifer adhaerens]|nr:hypothetical protein SAMN05421890_2243 [Ensifer adhaerens]
MKHLMIAAAAALLFTGFGVTTASADPYGHHRHGGYRHHGAPGIWIGERGVRVVPPRHHRRDCWLEKRVKRDHRGYRHVYTVRVCR